MQDQSRRFPPLGHRGQRRLLHRARPQRAGELLRVSRELAGEAGGIGIAHARRGKAARDQYCQAAGAAETAAVTLRGVAGAYFSPTPW